MQQPRTLNMNWRSQGLGLYDAKCYATCRMGYQISYPNNLQRIGHAVCLVTHVKSCQDDNIPVASLSLKSRLNVEADWLMKEYMAEDKTRWPIGLFPLAKAQLIITEASATRKIPQVIHFAAGSIALRPYLMERNLWMEQTMDDITTWDAHGASHSYHHPQCCYLVKLCHRHLLIGQTLHCWDDRYSPTCPGCQLEPKTQHHYYLQCLAPSHIEWRIKLLAALRKQTETLKTNESLQEAILNCIDSTLSTIMLFTQTDHSRWHEKPNHTLDGSVWYGNTGQMNGNVHVSKHTMCQWMRIERIKTNDSSKWQDGKRRSSRLLGAY
jgi:hypothetical protein